MNRLTRSIHHYVPLFIAFLNIAIVQCAIAQNNRISILAVTGRNSITMVPANTFADDINAKYQFDNKVGGCTITHNALSVSLQLYDTEMKSGNSNSVLCIPPFQYHGDLYIPLREVARVFGVVVIWDGEPSIIQPETHEQISYLIDKNMKYINMPLADNEGYIQVFTAYTDIENGNGPSDDPSSDIWAAKEGKEVWHISGFDYEAIESLTAIDLTNDGIDELVIGVWFSGGNGEITTGAVYVYKWDGATFHSIVATETGYIDCVGPGLGMGGIVYKLHPSPIVMSYSSSGERVNKSRYTGDWYRWDGTVITMIKEKTSRTFPVSNGGVRDALHALGISGAVLIDGKNFLQ